MNNINTVAAVNIKDLEMMIAHKIKADKRMIFPFADSTGFLTELLKIFYKPSSNFVGGGHVTPDIAIAADRAEINLVEAIPESPFTGNTDTILEQIKNKHDIVYLANPNKITAANYSVSDIEPLAKAVPGGALIIDEHYYGYYGITGLPLLDLFDNIVILRSFTAQFGIYSSDAGFAVGNPDMVKKLKNIMIPQNISTTIRRTILTSLMNDDAMVHQLRETNEESLRITTLLTKLGVQCRITATDFLLMRVASPKDVGNFLNRFKVTIDNLNGYPLMNNYIKYRIESQYSNDRLLSAFTKMPPNYYRMKTIDRRAVSMRGAKEKALKRDRNNRINKEMLSNRTKKGSSTEPVTNMR